MKSFLKFILSALILLCCISVADCLIGLILDTMIDKVPNDGNETGSAHYAIKKVTAPVLIVGSSRAKYHYKPDIIADSLSLETYNIGRGGYYLSYHCCLINMILDRYTPDVIIWDFSMDALFANGDDPVNKLRPYYKDYPAVREVLDEKEGKASKLSLFSNTYRYNGMAISIIYRCIAGGDDFDPKNGMAPIVYSGHSVDPELRINPGLCGPIDKERVNRLHSTLQRLNDACVKVFVIDSPNYSIVSPDRDLSSETIIYEECQRLSIPVIDNRNLDYFLHHPELFYDEAHLFGEGAEEYTKMVAHQILEVRTIE